MQATKVLVVGAGPTGLTLACELLARGVDASVIDKAAGPATTSRALGLQPRGVEILDRVGALGDLRERAVQAMGVSVFVGQRRMLHIAPAELGSVSHPGVLMIGQSEIEAQLRVRLGELGGTVRWGHELTMVTEDSSGITAAIRAGESDFAVRADWLVGCDGAHSRVRELARIGFDGEPNAETFVLADAQLDWQRSREETAMWPHREGGFAAIPLPGTDLWRQMAQVPDGTSPGDGPAMIELLQGLMLRRTGDATTSIRHPAWTSTFRIHQRLARSYRRGRMLLAADAAHIHSPLGGQGMNTGLDDAHNLGWKLALVARHRATDRLLDSYQAERRPVATDVLATTGTATRLLLGATPLARLMRDRMVLPVMRTAPAQHAAMAKASQLHLGYRGGPLAHHTPLSRLHGRGPWPGDPGPNAACVIQPEGTPTSLTHQARGGWALLLFGRPSADHRQCAAAVREQLGSDMHVFLVLPPGTAADTVSWVDAQLEDRTGELARGYRPGRALAALLRPDGHVGWRGHPAAGKLSAWISGVLQQGRAR